MPSGTYILYFDGVSHIKQWKLLFLL